MQDEDFVSKLQKQRAMPHMLVLEHVSPATRLLEKRRQMFEVQEVLQQQKANFARKEEHFHRQEEGLKRKDLDLQESLIKFSKFLQENDGKVARAERKAKEEVALRQAKEVEIFELERTLKDLACKCAQVDAVVEGSMKYQQYLESVVEADADVHEVTELLNRHSTLAATNSDLKAQQAANTAATERVRREMAAFAKVKSDEILHMNNRVARMKQQLEAVKAGAADQEAVNDSALQAASKNMLNYGRVIMSTENLYARMKDRSHVSHPNETDPLLQLDAIGNYVADLVFVLKAWRKHVGT